MKDIPGYEGRYAITKDGFVYSIRYKRFIKNRINTNGYIYVDISASNLVRKMHQVHRLVAFTYELPNPLNKPFINHIDGIKTHNNLENLEWCTRSENSLHAHKLGLVTHPRGIDHCNAKLSEEAVLFIRENKQMGIKKLSKLFSVSATVIRCARNGKTWKHIKAA